jgi:hypothetical protein
MNGPQCYIIHYVYSLSVTLYTMYIPSVLHHTLCIFPQCYIMHYVYSLSVTSYTMYIPSVLHYILCIFPQCYMIHYVYSLPYFCQSPRLFNPLEHPLFTPTHEIIKSTNLFGSETTDVPAYTASKCYVFQ